MEFPRLIQNLTDVLSADSHRQNSISQRAGLFAGYLLDEELIWGFHRLLLQAKWGLAPSYAADLKALS